MSLLTEKELLAKLASLPRFHFLHLPTPLTLLSNWSQYLRGPKIYIKRDDLSGVGFGGNKSRKLEFIIADAVQNNYQAIFTWGSLQSNWCFQTALAARRCGLKPALLLFIQDRKLPAPRGNLLLDCLLEAELYFSPAPPGKIVSRELALSLIEDLAPDLEKQGLRPYVVSVGGSMPVGSMTRPLGAISYVQAFYETWVQAKAAGYSFTHVVHATGSGATQAGLLVGAKLLNPQCQIIGISVSEGRELLAQEVLTIARASAAALDLALDIKPEEIIIFDEYVEGGYGVISKKVAQTLQLLLQQEGIVLDPVYTAKAMLGLMDLINRGYFKPHDSVIFFHTGGTPALFAYGQKILNRLKK